MAEPTAELFEAPYLTKLFKLDRFRMSLPRVTRQWLVQKLSQNFRESVALQEVPLAEPSGREMIIKNHAVGINASDVNFTSGAYMPGVKPPFPCGFEAVGTVVAAGPKAIAKEGDTVCYMEYGAFADYQTTSKGKNKPV